jgi:hypothetical protein
MLAKKVCSPLVGRLMNRNCATQNPPPTVASSQVTLPIPSILRLRHHVLPNMRCMCEGSRIRYFQRWVTRSEPRKSAGLMASSRLLTSLFLDHCDLRGFEFITSSFGSLKPQNRQISACCIALLRIDDRRLTMGCMLSECTIAKLEHAIND